MVVSSVMIVEAITKKKIFKDIRHNDIDAVRNTIKKRPAVVNEVFDGQKPKKDVGQSPLQVAIKCGRFEIIDLLIENGADVDFMENPADKPDDTSASYFMCMSVLQDAIIGAIKGTFGTAFSEWGKKLLKTDSKVVKKIAGTLLGQPSEPKWMW